MDHRNSPIEKTVELDIRRFAKHVARAGPENALRDFLYGLFVVADEIMRTGALGKSYPKPGPSPKEAPVHE